jgi:chloramphenicol 3-O-phosphotransferase
MIMLQSILVAVRRDTPVVAALHPVNGFAILLVGIAMAREAWAARENREPATAATAQAAGATAAR